MTLTEFTQPAFQIGRLSADFRHVLQLVNGSRATTLHKDLLRRSD